ncbi:MAG: GntR family transcriptional regulator [Chloroflexi bacterium]|nr:GntR family transcriptional regulator [Chloroflexota bacterium]
MPVDKPVPVRYKGIVGNVIDNKKAVHPDGGVTPDERPEAAPAGGETPSRLLLPDQVRAFIERQLLDGTLSEGDQIVEYRVARTLGISQAPVREALRKLERDGLVVTRPHRGTFVRRVTRRDAAERYSLGMELEAFAARLAMPRLTPADYSHLERIIDDMSRAATCARAGSIDFARSVELNVSFHRFLVERANHKMLLDAWLAVNPLNWRFTTYTQLVNPDPVVLAERHRSVLTALRSGDQVMAAATLRAHIWDVAEQVLPNMAEESEGEDEPVV